MSHLLDRKRAEREMADWLAHPMEFGVRPRVVRYRHTHTAKLITYGDVSIHLVEYEMPDGTRGRGFVNGPLTWSFLGDDVNAISDGDLFIAYCGWAWLFLALQAGNAETEFDSAGEEASFAQRKTSQAVADFRITNRYRIGSSEVFEYQGTRDGVVVKGAGNTEQEVEVPSSDTRSALPAIYFLLGRVAIIGGQG